MILHLPRDDTRFVQERFFPYLKAFLAMKIRETQAYADQQLNFKILESILTQIDKLFLKRLNGQAQKFKIILTDAEGITLVKLLIAFPIEQQTHYATILRQEVINQLHKQIT